MTKNETEARESDDVKAPATSAEDPGDESPPEKWDGTNLSGDKVEAGIQRNDSRYREDLRWAWRYGLEQQWSQAELAEALGVSTTVVSRVFRGQYTNPEGKMLAPPTVMLSRIREIRKLQYEMTKRRDDRVMTPTVRRIWQLCHKISGRDAEGNVVPGQKRLMGFLYGDSHLGKTEALQWYREEFNHGKTIYVDLQGCSGVQDIYREFARALGLSPNTAPYKLTDRVVRAINSDTLIICDELHHITYAYQKGSSKRSVNALKNIKDKSRCAMLLCGTYVAHEEIESGREAKLMRQLKTRAASRELHLPKGIPVYDVRAIAEANGLLWVELPKRARDKNGVNLDTWARARKEANGTGLEPAVLAMEDMAYHSGIESIFTNIEDGKLIARREKRTLEWADVIRAFQINQSMKIKEEI